MTFTYTASPAVGPRRGSHLLSDTNSDDVLLTDGTINWLLDGGRPFTRPRVRGRNHCFPDGT